MPTVRPRGNTFQALARVKKNGVIIFQQSKNFNSERLALDWARKMEDSVRKNGAPDTRTSQKTLASLLYDYLTDLEKVKDVRRARFDEIHQIAPFFANDKLDSLNPSVFVKFAEKRRAEGAGPTTIMHNLATIRAILNAARPMYNLDVTAVPVSDAIKVLQRIGAASRSNSRDRRPSPAELELLIEELTRIQAYPSTKIPMHVILPLTVALPRRIGELTAARWSDLDETKRLLTLRDTKNPVKPRTEVVPVPRAATEIIMKLPRFDELILPYNSESCSAAFQRACARLNIKDLHLHDMRHEGISRLFEQGYSTQEVALVSGHISWQMLRRYTHLEAATVASKMNKEPINAGE